MTDNPAPTEATTGNDLLYRATVDDQTAAFFNRFDANVAKSGATANTGFGNVTKASEGSNASLTKLAAAFGLATSISTMFFNVVAKGVRDLENLVAESVQAASLYDRLGTTMYVLGQRYGYDKAQLDAYQTSMEKQNMSMSGARQAVVRMLQSNIDLSKAEQIAKLAADASVITNTSVATSMDRIIRSIQVLQPRYLRTMGIYVDVRKANEDYAKSMGTTVALLDETTKRHIFLDAVLEKAKDTQGAYTASLTTAAGQTQLQQQHLADLKVTLGELAQPALLEWLRTQNELLEKALKWLNDNKGELKKLSSLVGSELALAFKDLLKIVNGVFTVFSNVLNKFGEWGNAIAGIQEPPGVKKTSDDLQVINNVITAGIKLLGLYGATFAWVGTQIAEEAAITTAYWKAVFSGDMVEANRLQAIHNSAAWKLQVQIDAADAFDAKILETVNILNDGEKAKTDFAGVPLVTDDQIAALDQLDKGLQDLHDKLEQQAADAATKKTRDAIETALKDGWKQEDMARDLSSTINGIEAQGQDDKLKLVQDYAQKRWQVEHDYVLALKKLKENFEFDANEAARRRDAVEMLALSRKYNKDLKDLKDNKTEQSGTSKKSYDTAVKDLNDSLQKQVKKANDTYRKQEEDLYRSKRRDMVIQQLHDKWTLEDIQTQTGRELQVLINQYNALDGATHNGLVEMLNEWGWYFGALNTMIAGNSGIMGSAMPFRNNNNSATSPNNVPPTNPNSNNSSSGTTKPPTNPYKWGPIIGQAGQVTSFLTPSGISRPAALDTVPVSRLPSVSPTSGTVRKEVAVTVNGNGLNPYIQRQLVRTLTEIERNSP